MTQKEAMFWFGVAFIGTTIYLSFVNWHAAVIVLLIWMMLILGDISRKIDRK